MAENDTRYAFGIDLGGTKIEIGIVSDKGELIDICLLKTMDGPEAIQEQILSNIAILRRKKGLKIEGVGIGVAGQIHPITGTVIFAPNLKWHNIPLKTIIEQDTGLPISVVNDVRAIMFGEWFYGAGKNEKDLLCIFVGTGIGGAVVSNGRLLTGFSNSFGEVGHMTIDYKGPICTCGKKGCFEALAGGWGIAARAQDMVKEDKQGPASQMLLELSNGSSHKISAKNVIEAYRKNDPMAIGLIQNFQEALIAGLASLINLYNPAKLIIGGGVIDGFPEIFPLIKKGISERALKAATNSYELTLGKLGKGAGVIGAAASIFKQINEGMGEDNNV